MNLKILIVTPDFPYPTIHGGRVDYYNRIKCLAEMGLDVHLISTVSEDIPGEDINEMKKYVTNLIVVKRNKSIKNLFSLTPHQILCRAGLKKVSLNDETYDFILLEGEHVISILNNTSFKYKSSYLRIHNIESKYYYSLALATLPKVTALYYFVEGLKFNRVQEKISKRFDKLLYISSEELRQTKSKEKGIHILPVYSRNEQMETYVKKESKMALFVGSLFMPNNMEALDFYLKKVHVKLLDIPGYKFIVIGSTKRNEELKKLILRKYKNDGSVEFHFDVDTSDIKPIYRKARFFVNPVLHGAGVKLKVLEAIRNGLLVVSTPEGVAGTGLKNNHEVILQSNAQDIANAIRQIFSNEINEMELVSNAQKKIDNSYRYLAQLFASEILPS